MKVHFNYNASKMVQIIIEDDDYQEQFVSRFYKDDADIIKAFNENNLESEESERKLLDDTK